MKNLKPQYAPTISMANVLNQHNISSFDKVPYGLVLPTDAEFRALGPLYDNFADTRSKVTAERGLSRKSLRTHVVMLDVMLSKRWIGVRGPQDNAVFLTGRGAKVYEFAYYYYQEKQKVRNKFMFDDDPRARENAYRRGMPKALIRLLDANPELDAVKVYRTYRKLGKEATVEFYQNGDREDA